MWLGLDIGGANLKAASECGRAVTVPFQLWQTASELPARLREIGRQFSGATQIAVTMTGELADCFRDRSSGVRFILGSVGDAFPELPTAVYQTTGGWVTRAAAAANWRATAASNWHALARFTVRYLQPEDECALLIDIGSTTTDVIPIIEGAVAASALDDFGRLRTGELLYNGVQRTPVCCVLRRVTLDGVWIEVPHEVFATMQDVYVCLGWLNSSDAGPTADGRSASLDDCRARIARSILLDPDQATEEAILGLCTAAAEEQMALVAGAIQRVSASQRQTPVRFVLSGSGEFVAKRIVAEYWPQTPTVRLSQQLGPPLSRAATAYALATLAAEELSCPQQVAALSSK